jgi:hypothetical protein
MDGFVFPLMKLNGELVTGVDVENLADIPV